MECPSCHNVVVYYHYESAALTDTEQPENVGFDMAVMGNYIPVSQEIEKAYLLRQ